jgi:hypothetical protein
MTAGLAERREGGVRVWSALAGVARAMGAWLAADLTAALTILLGFGAIEYLYSPATPEEAGQFLLAAIPLSLYVGVVVAVLTALPMIGIVFLMRLTRIRRGISDVLFSGVMGAALIQLLYLPSLPNPQAPAMATLFFIAGMVGGYTYWLVAGRPR